MHLHISVLSAVASPRPSLVQFELADYWVPGVGATEYANWLWELYQAVATCMPAAELVDASLCAFDARLAPPDEDPDEAGQSEGANKATERSGRQRIVQEQKKRKRATTQIQAVFRGRQSRSQREKRDMGARTLQAGRRGQLARRPQN